MKLTKLPILAGFAGLTLSHQCMSLPNNSVVTLNDIGEDLVAIFCFTNQEDCCQLGSGARWLLPDGTVVDSRGNLFVNRGLSALSLNRVPDLVAVNGLYRCEIPDSEGVIQTLYAGLYSDNTGNVYTANNWQTTNDQCA